MRELLFAIKIICWVFLSFVLLCSIVGIPILADDKSIWYQLLKEFNNQYKSRS